MDNISNGYEWVSDTLHDWFNGWLHLGSTMLFLAVGCAIIFALALTKARWAKVALWLGTIAMACLQLGPQTFEIIRTQAELREQGLILVNPLPMMFRQLLLTEAFWLAFALFAHWLGSRLRRRRTAVTTVAKAFD